MVITSRSIPHSIDQIFHNRHLKKHTREKDTECEVSHPDSRRSQQCEYKSKEAEEHPANLVDDRKIALSSIEPRQRLNLALVERIRSSGLNTNLFLRRPILRGSEQGGDQLNASLKLDLQSRIGVMHGVWVVKIWSPTEALKYGGERFKHAHAEVHVHARVHARTRTQQTKIKLIHINTDRHKKAHCAFTHKHIRMHTRSRVHTHIGVFADIYTLTHICTHIQYSHTERPAEIHRNKDKEAEKQKYNVPYRCRPR